MDHNHICIQRALEANALREPVFRTIVPTLQLPLGSRGLDAGCGIGLQAMLLAEAVGPAGHITGVDITPAVVTFGNEQIRQAGYADRIKLREGDVNHLPFADATFDWVWSADCVGYPAGELTPVLAELMRVVKPGGSIILLGWTSQQLLPGHPLLEAYLNATCSAYIPFFAGQKPEMNFLRALRWFQAAGLEDMAAQTFVGEVQAPLSSSERTALLSLFEMLWTQPPAAVSSVDWHTYRRLCNLASPDFILDLPDYYAFFTYSLFRGIVPLARSTS